MSAFSQEKNIAIPVGATQVSDKFCCMDFQRGSFMVTAAVTGNLNFDVSDDGLNWETLSAAAGTFTDIPVPPLNKPRSLPSSLFAFRFARFHTAAAQVGADGAILLRMIAN